MIDDWYDLEIGKVSELDNGKTKIIRVPGGWVKKSADTLLDKDTGEVMQMSSTAVFIPYIEKDKA